MLTFETNRLFLSSFDVGNDVTEYYKIINERSIREYLPLASPRTKKDLVELVTKYSKSNFKDDFYLKIQLKYPKKIIGSILAYRSYNGVLSVSYLIGKPYRNNGYIVEALKGFIGFIAENSKEFKTFVFRIRNDNVASTKVMEALGATKKVGTSVSTVWQINI